MGIRSATSYEAPKRVDKLRAFNIILSLAVLIFAAPLMVCIAAVIWLQDGGPVFYGHVRIGQGGRRFHCLKFRSMVMNAEQALQSVLETDPVALAEWVKDHKLRNDPRITPIGHFLRRLSLDELPQLINVLRGDMELVGPRPIVESEIEKYGRYFQAYCSVRPGITGLWQISGRNDVTYRQRVALDVIYTQQKTPMMDLYILAATIPAVLMSKGSY